MLLLYYVLKGLLSKKSIKDTHVYKGFKFYTMTKKHERKNILLVIYELEKLTWYWRCYPETYFIFSMHLKVFKDFNVMKSFIVLSYYNKYVGKTPYDILINDKLLFNDVMNYYGIPVPELFFTYKNGQFYRNNAEVTDMEIDQLICEIQDNVIFVKKNRGGGGRGVFVFTKKDNFFCDNQNVRVTAKYIRKSFKNQVLLFQRQVIQDSILRKFNSDTLNTIRVQVIKNKSNKIEIIAAAVRFGRQGNYLDNASQGGLVVSLDINSGRMANYASILYDLNKYYLHPDSKLPFKDEIIQQWEDIKQLVYKTMNYLPYYKGVGIDVATTDNGPILIEINTGAGMNLPQLGKDYGIAEKFI